MQELSTLGYIILFTFLGGVFSLIGGIVLLSRRDFTLKISHLLASFAAGALLGAAFFDLLPEAVMEMAAHGAEEAEHLVEEGMHADEIAHATEVGGFGYPSVFFWVLLGMLFFFLLERFLHWFHHHHEHEGTIVGKPTVLLIIVGDTIHNFIDGVAIAATFMISIPLGVVTSIAVAAHEIPQEIGDFGILLHRGLSRKKVLIVNILSAFAAVAGALIMYTTGGAIEGLLPIVLAVTAGFFIYIAASDLIPEIHQENRKGFALIETTLLILGVVVVWASIALLEATIGHGH